MVASNCNCSCYNSTSLINKLFRPGGCEETFRFLNQAILSIQHTVEAGAYLGGEA